MPEPEDVQAYQVADAERMLRSLEPSPCQIDRPRFFYEAGRIHAESRVAVASGASTPISPWAFASAVMLLISLTLAGALGWSMRPDAKPNPEEVAAEEFARGEEAASGEERSDVVLGSRARVLQGEGGEEASEALRAQDRRHSVRPDEVEVSDGDAPPHDRSGG